jgi:zinc protease
MRANPDYYAVQVMNYILGAGGFGSRLMDKIREELGLVYHVGSSFSARKHAGPFTVSLQTKNASAVQALDETMQVIRRFTEEGPTDKEVEAAKSYLINSFPLRLVSNRDVASLLPVLEFYELGLDYPDRYPTIIGNITREQVHAAAKSYLHPDRMLQVVVADLTQAGLAKP